MPIPTRTGAAQRRTRFALQRSISAIIAQAQANRRSAASARFCGVPKVAITSSPIYLSTVPPKRNTVSDIRVWKLRKRAIARPGARFSVNAVNPTTSTNSTPTFSARLKFDRVATGGQLVNDIRREIPGEIRVRAFRNHLPQYQPARAPNRKGQDCGGQKQQQHLSTKDHETHVVGVEKDRETLLQGEVGQVEKAGAALRDGVRQPIDNPETDAPIHHRDEARPQHQHRRVAQHRADDKGVEIEKIGGAKGDLRWRLARDQRVRDDQHGSQQGDLHQQIAPIEIPARRGQARRIHSPVRPTRAKIRIIPR